MSRASVETSRTKIVDAAANGRPLLFDLRNARPSCVQYIVTDTYESARAFCVAR